jgi:hypothetical protein
MFPLQVKVDNIWQRLNRTKPPYIFFRKKSLTLSCNAPIYLTPSDGVSGDERTRKTGGHRRRNKIEYSGQ